MCMLLYYRCGFTISIHHGIIVWLWCWCWLVSGQIALHATAAVPPTGTRSVVFNKGVCSWTDSLPGLRLVNSIWDQATRHWRVNYCCQRKGLDWPQTCWCNIWKVPAGVTTPAVESECWKQPEVKWRSVRRAVKSSVLTAAWLIDWWLVRSVKSETEDIFSEYNSKDEECSSDDGDATTPPGGVSVSKCRDILHS